MVPRSSSRSLLPLLGFALVLPSAACGSDGSNFVDDDDAVVSGGKRSTSGKNGTAGNGGVFGGTSGDGGAIGTETRCAPSPANVEVPGNGCDDDADGRVDVETSCDDALGEDGDANAFARAIGLCKVASGDSWGLVKAEYRGGFTRGAPPNALQHGILSKFGTGVKPREGNRLGVLSTGQAREFNGPGGKPFRDGGRMNSGGGGDVAPGFPAGTPGCPVDSEVNDVIDLRLTIKAPANAKAIGFDFSFYSSEWPAFICSRFNDGFAAILASKAWNGGTPGNISFDAQKNPISVNNGFFDVCTPNVTAGCRANPRVSKTFACARGTSEIEGTGFFGSITNECPGTPGSQGGATGWLGSQAPVAPGETLTLDLVIWDTSDYIFDSSVLVDHVHFVGGGVTVAAPVTERPPPR
ncbi:MAG: choice-of-anchor L domain-containing protein [Polyangiaceae bacterium]